MKLHFLGANRQVTGSRYCLEIGETRILIDCGMFQERSYLSRNWKPSTNGSVIGGKSESPSIQRYHSTRKSKLKRRCACSKVNPTPNIRRPLS
jgi:hypothetical protein